MGNGSDQRKVNEGTPWLASTYVELHGLMQNKTTYWHYTKSGELGLDRHRNGGVSAQIGVKQVGHTNQQHYGNRTA